MYLKKIHIQNFRAIEDLEIELEPGVNLLVGNSGVGKTSVLEGIAAALGGLFVKVVDVRTKNIAKGDVHMNVKSSGGSSIRAEYCESVRAGCTLHVGNEQEFTWNRIKEKMSSAHTKIDDKSVCSWMKKLTNNFGTKLPLISFQSAARRWRAAGTFGAELNKKLNDRRCAYTGCLDSSMDVKAIRQWCLIQELVTFQKGTVREYEMFKNIVTSCMKEIDKSEDMPVIYYSASFDELIYKNGKTEMPISKLGAGCQSLLWMIMDLAYRACLLNPELKSIEQIEGVVLIDDIELHLHPKQQWNIVGALSKVFKNVQFIITSNSPIIISSVPRERVKILGNGKIYNPAAQTYGRDVGSILRETMETSERPTDIEQRLKIFYALMGKGNYSEADKVLTEIERIVGETDPGIAAERASLDLEKISS